MKVLGKIATAVLVAMSFSTTSAIAAGQQFITIGTERVNIGNPGSGTEATWNVLWKAMTSI